MKKKTAKSNDINVLMAQIQEQLAVLDRKLDAFMTKSLNELAQALAASKPAQVVHVPAPSGQSSNPRPNDFRPARQMYAVVCFECGKDTEIPFKPSGDRPVFCKECFSKRKSGQGAKAISEPRPQGAPSIEATASVRVPAKPALTGADVTPSVSKKKTPAKKTAAKKKTAVKKSPKRK